MKKLVLLLGAVVALSACESEQPEPKVRWTDRAAPAGAPVKMRWYTPEQVEAGATLYAQNCASCHKPNAEGTLDWQTRYANGKLPPPPLNGSRADAGSCRTNRYSPGRHSCAGVH